MSGNLSPIRQLFHDHMAKIFGVAAVAALVAMAHLDKPANANKAGCQPALPSSAASGLHAASSAPQP